MHVLGDRKIFKKAKPAPKSSASLGLPIPQTDNSARISINGRARTQEVVPTGFRARK
jgi:hypothetical protein